MAQNTTSIAISHERRIQLNQIAEAFGGGLTAAETIGRMARELARLGIVSTTIEGIEINRASDGLAIILDNGDPVSFTGDEARELGDLITRYVESDDRLTEFFNVDADYRIARQARTVNIHIPASGPVRRLPLDIARDLAAALHREADALAK